MPLLERVEELIDAVIGRVHHGAQASTRDFATRGVRVRSEVEQVAAMDLGLPLLHREFSQTRAGALLRSGADEVHRSAIGPESATLLYSIVRYRQPSFLLETGTQTDISALVIAEALHANGVGHLTSLDIREFQRVQEWQEPYLASIARFDVVQPKRVPRRIEQLAAGQIDWGALMDSRNTFAHQRRELKALMASVPPATLMVNNAEMSRAFLNSTKEAARRGAFVSPRGNVFAVAFME